MHPPIESTVTRLVADALGLVFPAEAWARLERRGDIGALADRIEAMGSAIGIGYLASRTDDESLRTILTERAPVVLVPNGANGGSSGNGAHAGQVVVVNVADGQHSARGAGTPLVHVDATGEVAPMSGGLEARIQEIHRLVGRDPIALAPLALAPERTTDRLPDHEETGTPTSVAGARQRAAAESPGAFARLAELLRGDRRDITIVFFYAALAGIFALTLPLSVGAIVGLVQGGLILQPVVILIGYVIVGTLVSGALQVLQLGVVERIQQRIFARMALEFSFRVPRIRYDVAMSHDLPETMNRLFEAITIQKSLSKVLLDSSQALLTVIAGLIVLTFYHPYFFVFGLVLLVVLGAILWVSGPRGLATSLVESKYKYRALHWLEEQARAFHAFKFSGRGSLGIRRMDEILTGYLIYRRKHFRILVGQTISIVLFRALIVGGFLIMGTQLVIDRQISLGQFVASELVVVTVLLGVEKLILSMSVIYDVLTSAEKAGHVLDLPLDDAGGTPLPASRRGMAIDLRNLSYRYVPDAPPVLRNVTLRIAPGERIAITGPEGAGSTTLIRLVAGLLDQYDGTMLVDGMPLRIVDRAVMREQIGQYLSATDLFDGSILENVAVGRAGIDMAVAREAIDAVGLTKEIEDFPQGMDTLIDHGGQRLPNYVAIKLLFAQAVAGNPRLLVIDDLFQNLQAADRTRLWSLVTDPARAWTVVIISHDPEVLAAVDRVIVLEGGEVVHDGPMAELREQGVVHELVELGALSPAAEDS
ncbi:MAG TPA: ATP-binding cassette domain-containing protein [Gemmatimonas sp.]|nr:ATP-binding cassette domain-containing protein [Gemmatimonas sp.]